MVVVSYRNISEAKLKRSAKESHINSMTVRFLYFVQSRLCSLICGGIVIIKTLIGYELASLPLPTMLKSWPNFSRVCSNLQLAENSGYK